MRFVRRVLPEALKPYSGRVALTALGLLVAVLLLTIGFWRTLLIALLCVVGYLAGKWADGALDISELPLIGRL